MLVLHGAWGVERGSGDAAFLVWAEAGNGRTPPRTPNGPAAHPFQASGTGVRRALYDLAALASLYRVGSFIGLGLLLLVAAGIWQRMRPPALPDLRDVPPAMR